MKIPVQLSLLLFLYSCVSAEVRQSHLDAWVRHSPDELASHPHFSKMELERRELQDFRELYVYTQQITGPSETECYEDNGRTVCSGPPASVGGCWHRFLVYQGQIESYRMLSYGGARCVPDCRLRPESRPCEEEK